MAKIRALPVSAAFSLLSACASDPGDEGTSYAPITGGPMDGGNVYDAAPPLGVDSGSLSSGFPSSSGSSLDAAGLADAFVPSNASKPDAASVTSGDASAASGTASDAASSDASDAASSDAGESGPSDAASSDASDATVSSDASSASSGTCGGTTPHGCYTPKAGNPMGCPPRIHEQSEFYPPFEEWEACESPYYEPCTYLKPGGAGEAHCECDLGVHWLCTY